MKLNFKKAIFFNNITINIVAVNVCCYGKGNSADKGEYLKLYGQNFWELFSADKDLYVNLIQPIGHQAKQKNDEFYLSYAILINNFNKEFLEEFCTQG